MFPNEQQTSGSVLSPSDDQCSIIVYSIAG